MRSQQQAATNIALFESRTVPRGSEPTGASALANSSPVDVMPTTTCTPLHLSLLSPRKAWLVQQNTTMSHPSHMPNA